MHYVLDRFEEDTAVLQQLDGQAMLMLARTLLPASIAEGDVLLCEDGIWQVDDARTKQRKQALEQRFFSLFKD